MHFLYNFFIYAYLFAIKVASLFNSKAKLWLNGRKDIFARLHSSLITHHSSLIWVHCASLGEFEQGRPFMERIKLRHKDAKILLTFFSPSGYEICKNYAFADYVFYLPIDTKSNAQNFLDIIKPKAAFFVKYEFWFNYLNELKERNIPTYLVSGIFREDHYFFKNYSAWFRKQLNCFTYFFVQDEQSEGLLKSIGFNNVIVSGDTRFDRVNEISKNVKEIDIVKQFVADKNVIVAGSTWNEDEKILASYFTNNQQLTTSSKLIIAPHEIDEQHIQSIIQRFSSSAIIRFSQANEINVKAAQILIIDNIGMLSSLYQYGTIAFIGGGFGKGIHNILEPAAFGLPIIFGPKYQKFIEAKELINFGGAFSISNQSEFENIMSLLSDIQVLQTASFISRNYVQTRVGATDRILSSVLLK